MKTNNHLNKRIKNKLAKEFSSVAFARIVLFIILMVFSVGCQKKQKETKEIHISIAADTHISNYSEECNKYPKANDNLEQLTKLWVDTPPDFGIFLGDLLELDQKDSDNCYKESDWNKHAKIFKDSLKDLCNLNKGFDSRRWLSIIGNNDWNDSNIEELNLFTDNFLGELCKFTFDTEQKSEYPYSWIRLFPDDEIAFIGLYFPDRKHYYENWRCVRLNDDDECDEYRDEDKGLPVWEDQREWLINELDHIIDKEQKIKLIFILIHQPMVWNNPYCLPDCPNKWGKNADEKIPDNEKVYFQSILPDLITELKNRDRFSSLFDQSNESVLSGHYHIGQIASEYRGLDFILVPSLAMGERSWEKNQSEEDIGGIFADLRYYPALNELKIEIRDFRRILLERTIHFED
jgi:predicted MPP superfamily phosphohydrolase